MNKHECKKYITRAYNRLVIQSKSMNPENLAIEMDRVIKSESKNRNLIWNKVREKR